MRRRSWQNILLMFNSSRLLLIENSAGRRREALIEAHAQLIYVRSSLPGSFYGRASRTMARRYGRRHFFQRRATARRYI